MFEIVVYKFILVWVVFVGVVVGWLVGKLYDVE